MKKISDENLQVTKRPLVDGHHYLFTTVGWGHMRMHWWYGGYMHLLIGTNTMKQLVWLRCRNPACVNYNFV